MARAALQRYIAEQVQRSVVRIRDELIDPKAVATGFFIDPSGHLITAFHSVKHRFFAGTDRMPITIEFDATPTPTNESPAANRRHTVDAHTTLEWADPTADWALLKLDFRPEAYLPLAGSRQGHATSELTTTELRVHGFNITDQDLAKLSVFKGNHAGHLPDRRRHVVSYIVRTEGQSGGPVMDANTGSVIGSVVGYRSQEVLTGEVAALDRGVLAELGLGLDLGALARDWHAEAARRICLGDDTLAPLLDRPALPALPARALGDRAILRAIGAAREAGASSVYLHGAGGSGKSTIASQIAAAVAAEDDGVSVFSHDFAAAGHRGHEQLLRALAVHLLMRHGHVEAIMACVDDTAPGHRSAATRAILEATRELSAVFVFDNLHCLSEAEYADLAGLLAGLESAAAAGPGSSLVIFASRHAPPAGLRATVFPVTGFTDAEVADFLKLYGVSLEDRALSNVCRFGSNIVCIEEVARSPEWRRRVADGFDTASGTEPLRRYWTDTYADLPEADHRLLLTAAVMGRPTTREELEDISGVKDFARTLERLQRDPPLIKFNEGYFLHSDVESALLFVSDRETVSSLRSRAAGHLVRHHRYVEGARLHALVPDVNQALAVLYDHAESIITGGLVGDLEQLLHQLTEELRTDARAREAGGHHVNTLLARCHTAQGRYERARQHWHHAIRTAPDPSHRAALLRRLGDNDRMASDYTAAARSYGEAVELLSGADTHPDMVEFAGASIGLGKLDRLRADYRAAYRRYSSARDSYRHLLDPTGMAEAEFGIGEVKRLQSDWEAAARAYASSHEHARSIGNKERTAYALWGLGEISRLTGRLTEAMESHRAGLDICVEIGDRRSEGWALLGIGQVESALRHPELARAAYEEALLLFRRTKSRTEIAHTLLSLAESYRSGGEVRTSLYDESAALYEKLSLRHCLVQHSIVKACALRDLGKRRQSDGLLRSAYRLARQCEIPREIELITSMRKERDATMRPDLNFP